MNTHLWALQIVQFTHQTQYIPHTWPTVYVSIYVFNTSLKSQVFASYILYEHNIPQTSHNYTVAFLRCISCIYWLAIIHYMSHSWGPCYYYGSTLIPAWIRNCIRYYVWDQTSTVQLLRFGNAWVISSHTLPHSWLISHAGINVNPC